jgi:hypothetical protein
LHNVISIVRMGHSNHVMLKKCQEKSGHWYVLSANASKISLLDLRHVALSKHGLHMYFNLQSQCNLIIYKRNVSHDKNSFFTRPFYTNSHLAFSLLCGSKPAAKFQQHCMPLKLFIWY